MVPLTGGYIVYVFVSVSITVPLVVTVVFVIYEVVVRLLTVEVMIGSSTIPISMKMNKPNTSPTEISPFLIFRKFAFKKEIALKGKAGMGITASVSLIEAVGDYRRDNH